MSKVWRSNHQKESLSKVQQSQRRLHIILLVPSVIIIFGLLGYPLTTVVFYSFQERNTLEPTGSWVGLANYIRILQDDSFWQALRVDIVWTIGAMALSAVIGLGISLLLQERFRLRNVVRSLALFPYIVPTIVVILIFRYMFNDLHGIVNHILQLVGLEGQNWLASPRTALTTLIFVGTWKFYPLFIITLLGRLQMIPISLYEAARVDGANYLQCFRYITWPAILPIFLLTLLLRMIWTFNNFDVVYLLNQGGPLNSTLTLPLLVYKTGFGEFNLGYSSAIATIMIVILIIASLVYFALQERVRRYYG